VTPSRASVAAERFAKSNVPVCPLLALHVPTSAVSSTMEAIAGSESLDAASTTRGAADADFHERSSDSSTQTDSTAETSGVGGASR
jgi:hypothetical protein